MHVDLPRLSGRRRRRPAALLADGWNVTPRPGYIEVVSDDLVAYFRSFAAAAEAGMYP